MDNYTEESGKVRNMSEESLHSEKLLALINGIAVDLITIDFNNFKTVLVESMKKIGECLDVDCAYIWKLCEMNGQTGYKIIYDWISPNIDSEKTFEKIFQNNFMPLAPDWDDRMFSEKGYLAELANNFGEQISGMLLNTGVQAIMGFPAFFEGKCWGFVSFENRHSEKLCSEKEASILQSASLLLINAVERNDNIKQLSERLTQQQIMSDISKSFITKEPLDNLIQNALARMGEFIDVNRVLVAVFEKHSEVSRPMYFWASEPQYAPDPEKKGFSTILRKLFPVTRDNNDDSLGIYCDNAITYRDGEFKIFNEQAGLIGLVCVPIYAEGELWGTMVIEEHRRSRKWSASEVMLINTVSSAISNAVVRDVMEKERTAALEKAVQASHAKSDFLANMSHEIRTPMNAIVGMTAIGKSAHTMEKKDYAFDKIDDASKHLLGLINDILDMSKIEANKLELSPVTFEFEKMLQKVVNVINFRVEELRQKVYINIDNNIPRVLIGDDQRLAQVITNLLSNAVKFTGEEGTISLNAKLISEEEEMCCIEISVKDTGIGVTDEQKERLFNSFEQAESGTSRKFGGTGLGLSISKNIVEMMNGKIWVESAEGQGSKFSFTVDLKKGVERRKRTLGKGVNWENLRIFAVDDEPEIREFFTNMADNLSIHCDVAASGEEAAKSLEIESNYDIYFVDWSLPGMNGTELARDVITQKSSNSIVILFSGVDWSEIEEEARTIGVDKFLPKPLFQSTIVELINECFGSEEDEEEGGKEKSDFLGHTILLAEDVEINREVATTLLEAINLNIDCVENGVQALEKFRESPEKYDIIFMDIQMPEMDGYEATKHIRELDSPRAKEIPIVAMTANVFREDIENCLNAGMNDHVGKPINLDEIVAVLKKYIKKEN